MENLTLETGVKTYRDGRRVAESVSKYQNNMRRAGGW